MSAYGKVISGGKAMTSGLTKGINDKLKSFSESHKRSAMLATAVGKTFDQNPLSDPHHNDVNAAAKKSFTTPKLPSKV